MQGAAIPDVRPLIANDQWAVRLYLCIALITVAFGLLVFAVSILAFFKSAGDYQSLEKIGSGIGGLAGLVFSSLGALPLKEIFARRDRLRVLRVVEARLAELKTQSEIPDEYVKRMTELLWDMYRKVITG
jgi:hypothetical protein